MIKESVIREETNLDIDPKFIKYGSVTRLNENEYRIDPNPELGILIMNSYQDLPEVIRKKYSEDEVEKMFKETDIEDATIFLFDATWKEVEKHKFYEIYGEEVDEKIQAMFLEPVVNSFLYRDFGNIETPVWMSYNLDETQKVLEVEIKNGIDDFDFEENYDNFNLSDFCDSIECEGNKITLKKTLSGLKINKDPEDLFSNTRYIKITTEDENSYRINVSPSFTHLEEDKEFNFEELPDDDSLKKYGKDRARDAFYKAHRKGFLFDGLRKLWKKIKKQHNLKEIYENPGDVYELFSHTIENAIEHGNKNNHEKNVWLKYDFEELKDSANITVKVRDEGEGFDFGHLVDCEKKSEMRDDRSYNDSRKNAPPGSKGSGLFSLITEYDSVKWDNERKEMTVEFKIKYLKPIFDRTIDEI